VVSRVAWVGCILAHVCPAEAQDRSMRDVLSFLVTNQAVLTANVIKDREAAEATLDTLARAMLIDLATLPLGTSSSAFIYRFNSSLGTLERLTQSFGPFLVDRALTTGSRELAFGVAYRYARFTSLDGRDLRRGTLVTTANRFRDEPNAFDVETLTLRAATSTVTVLANLGVTDRIDVSAAIPIVRFDLSGERVNRYRGEDFVQARASAMAIGLADIALRGKAQIVGQGVSGLAAGLELRLPTGNRDDLIGAGRPTLKGSFIGSYGRGPFEIHTNVAMSGGGVSREVDVGGAAAIAATPRFTASAEILVRRVEELGVIADVIAPHPLIMGVDTIRLSPVGSSATTATGVIGVRWNVAGTWLVNGYVVLPITDRGLSAKPVPTVSIDYAFTP
jgi:hypothetical protein